MFLNNQWVTEEIKRGNHKISRNKWQWKHDNSKPTGCSKRCSKREVCSNTILPQVTKRKHQIDNLTLHLKQLEKEEEKKTKISRRKEIIKIQAKINEKEMKEIIVKINKMKSWFFEKINKIHKPLARLNKKKRQKNQINKIRNENGEGYNRQCRIMKNYKRLLWTTIWQ